MHPEIPPSHDASTVKVRLPVKPRRHIPNLLGWCFTAATILAAVALIVPVGSSTCVRGSQTRALAQAKTIGLALKIFAGDHEGRYPTQGVPAELSRAPSTSNAAYASLFPTYTTFERMFGNKLSAYQSAIGPDDVIDRPYTGVPVETLAPGENVYAYVAGLTDNSPPDAPLVLDGTNDGTTLYYNCDPKERGGVWEGRRAVVICLDNHGIVENLRGPDDARYIESRVPGRPKNLLDLSWLASDVHLLNPAVAP